MDRRTNALPDRPTNRLTQTVIEVLSCTYKSIVTAADGNVRDVPIDFADTFHRSAVVELRRIASRLARQTKATESVVVSHLLARNW